MTDTASTVELPRVFRNSTALAAWVFMAVWLAMLALFTWLAWRDGGIPQVGRWTWPLLGLFWLFGSGGVSWAASQPLTTLELSADGVVWRLRYPLRVEATRYRTRDIGVPRIEAAHDDGEECFALVLELRDTRIVVARGADRATMQRRRDQLHASLRRHCRGFSG